MSVELGGTARPKSYSNGIVSLRRTAIQPEEGASLLDSVMASGEDALLASPVSSAQRMGELSAAEEGVALPAEDARAQIDSAGLTGHLIVPDQGVTQPYLDILIDRKREEQKRAELIASAPQGVGPGAARFGAMFAASMLDPVNVATAYVPVVSQARYLRWLGKAGGFAGRAGVRAGVGAAEGVVGAALVEPVIAYAKDQEQADYDMADSLANVAFGTVFGGGLHVVGGAGADAVRGLRGKGQPWDVKAAPELEPTPEPAPAPRGPRVVDGALVHVPRTPVASVVAAEVAPDVFERSGVQPGESLYLPLGAKSHQGKPLHAMTIEELHAARSQTHEQDVRDLTEIFGNEKDAKFFARSSNTNSDAVYDRAQKLVEALSPEKQQMISDWESGLGRWRDGATADEIGDLIRELDIPDATSPQALGESLRYALINLGDKTDPATMNTKQLGAYFMLRESKEIIAQKGWNPKEVSRHAILAAASRFSDPVDAEFMLARFLGKDSVNTASAKAELAGPVKREAALRAAVAQAVTGRQIDVEGIINGDMSAVRRAAAEPIDALADPPPQPFVEVADDTSLEAARESLNEVTSVLKASGDETVIRELADLDEIVVKAKAWASVAKKLAPCIGGTDG